jgi:hypothetical protein
MRRQIRTTSVVAVVLLLGLPAAAFASSADVIRDCAQDGRLDKSYSQRELRDAEHDLPSDIDEYTDCRATIRAAMGGGTGSRGGPGLTSSGPVTGSPEDLKALEQIAAHAAKGTRSAVNVGGKKVLPGSGGLGGIFAGLQGANGMPAALVATVAALVVVAAVTAYLAAREKFPLVRRVALRVLGR